MRKHRIAGALCACLVVAGVATGCAKKPPVTTSTISATTREPSGSVVPTPAVEERSTEAAGSITTPEAGSETRTALMDAARKKLGTTAQFVVYQLYVQGDYAIGDLETTPGESRQFVAFKNDGEWEAEWVAPFGSAGASSASAKGEVPGLSAALLAKIDWKYKKPESSTAMIASLSAASKKWSKSLMDGQGQPYQVTLAKVAKDSKGVWWGRAVVQPSSSASNSYESIEFWCKYSGGAWTGKAQDPEPPAPTTYFPASVVGALGL